MNALDTYEIADLHAALIDRSLIAVDLDTGRYYALQTVRQYALERLAESGEADAVRGRHLAHFAAFADTAEPQLSGPDQQEWLDQLEMDHDNLRAAIDWSTAHDPHAGLRLVGAAWRFWEARGHLSEGRKRIAGLVAAARPECGKAECAGALRGAGSLAFHQGDYDEARTLQEQSLAICAELGDRVGSAASLNNLGTIAWSQGHYAQARALFERSAELYTDQGEKVGLTHALTNLGNLAVSQGEFAAARAHQDEALAIAKELGNRRATAALLESIGLAACRQNDFDAARTLLYECLQTREELGDRQGVARARFNLGVVAYEDGDFLGAGALFSESLTIVAELGDRRSMAYSLSGLAGVALDQGDFALAQTSEYQALVINRELADQAGIGASLHTLGVVSRKRGDNSAARALHLQSLAILWKIGNRQGVAYGLEGLASVEAELESLALAAGLWGAAQRLRQEIGHPLPSRERPAYDRAVAAARAALGYAAFDAAWHEGHAMTVEQAVEFALAEPAK